MSLLSSKSYAKVTFTPIGAPRRARNACRRLRVGLDAEGLGAAERDVGVEGQRLVGDQVQVGVAAGEFGDGDLGF